MPALISYDGRAMDLTSDAIDEGKHPLSFGDF